MADLGALLTGPPSGLANPAQVGPPNALALPQRQPGQAVQLPQGLNPIQAILYRAKNDPNFARALQVMSINLLSSEKQGGVLRNYAQAAGAGLSSIEQARAQERAQATQQSSEAWKRQQEERRTKAAETNVDITREGSRRTFIGQEAQRASNEKNAQRAHEIDLKRLAIDQAKAAQDRKAAGKETEADRLNKLFIDVVSERAARDGISLSETDKNLLAYELQQDYKNSKETSVNPAGFVNPFLTAGLGQGEFGDAVNLEAVRGEAVAGAKATAELLSTPAKDPLAALDAKLKARQVGLQTASKTPGGTSRGRTRPQSDKGFPILPPGDNGISAKVIDEDTNRYLVEGTDASGRVVQRWFPKEAVLREAAR